MNPSPDAADPAEIHAWGFSAWKRTIVPLFFPNSRLRFLRASEQPKEGAVVLAWGRRALPRALQGRLGRDLTRWSLEDGFLRSVGLGADLVRPLSWVVDRQGLYFDASRPSDLEVMLQHRLFTPPLLERAAALRLAIVRHAVTKYNLVGRRWRRPTGVRHVVLVPGQVESDASIRWGSPSIGSNLELLRAVREARPGAWIVYKPHPDVEAGLRRAGELEGQARGYCDEIAIQTGLESMLCQVEEVHTLTSLAGFEALLRGVPVTCWGQPFYAGWGVTKDRHPLARRTRRLGLDELVAGALLCYPRYLRRTGGGLCEAEDALADLLDWRRANPQPGAGLRERVLRPLLRWSCA
jgi:capsular polysaccharide export protein